MNSCDRNETHLPLLTFLNYVFTEVLQSYYFDTIEFNELSSKENFIIHAVFLNLSVANKWRMFTVKIYNFT